MDVITLAHGNGGRLTYELIENIIYKYFANDILLQQDDAASLPQITGRIATTTDSFVVDPIFFPGGDIGKLSVCGTVNDLAMNGATPLYITVGFILEEGLEIVKFKKIVKSLATTANKAGVKIVTGDTKVVERGKVDQIYINTTGIGVISQDIRLAKERIKSGDKVIVNGTLGDHGASILAERDEFKFKHSLKSDCRLLHDLVSKILEDTKQIRLLRDPTRGGLATTLKEIAIQNQISLKLNEENILFKEEVESLCEILGFDPLYLANEGKIIIIVGQEEVNRVVDIINQESETQNARIIGEVVKDKGEEVYLKTKFGGTRILDMLTDQLLPRIC